jgi:polysaccharide export outer membrane protein
MGEKKWSKRLALVCLLGMIGQSGGCVILPKNKPIEIVDAPHELHLTPLPPYVVEPPDILLIDTLRVVPKPPYKIEPLDALLIQGTDVLPTDPLNGVFGVEPEGTINLGLAYGKVRVSGLTLEQAQEAIQKQIEKVAKKPRITVSLAQAHGMQQIRGEHLIRPDGTVGLGVYGSVYVAGLTLAQTQQAIQDQLSQSLLMPEISVDVYSYNSKFYYIISDGAGYGQQVIRLPFTGKETVLDAISQIYGLPVVASTKHIWVARPNGEDPCGEQVLPVDWEALSKRGSPLSNYQLLPGDRLYVMADPLITTNNTLTKLFAPLERIFGVTLLGSAVVQSIQQIAHPGLGSSGTPSGF